MYLPMGHSNGKDMTGQKFGKLTVLGLVKRSKQGLHWECRCECGEVKVVKATDLRSGNTSSCGHKHGMTGSPEYLTWKGMIARCTNPKSVGYENYMARGITFDPDWAVFENFYRDMGDRPEGMTLDRENNDLGYNKANCRWATPQQQAINRRPRRSKKCP
jgi:hypothetical protein